MNAPDFQINRRAFLGRTLTGAGGVPLASMALASLLGRQGLAQSQIAPKAKRVIYLFQSGGPSHLELWDHKPKLAKLNGTELPDSIRNGQRLTGMTSGQKSFPVIASKFKFSQHGKAGAWISELLPQTAKIADDLCFIKSVHTEAINHDPAITFMQTGSQQPGRPSFGSWLSYGLGTMNQNLPGYVVLTDYPEEPPGGNRQWSTGFMPSTYQGTKFRAGATPILHVEPPPGYSDSRQRAKIDFIQQLNREHRWRYREGIR